MNKTKISTHKLQEELWKILINNKALEKGYDSGHIWDIAGDMLTNATNPIWNNITRTSLIQILCNLYK